MVTVERTHQQTADGKGETGVATTGHHRNGTTQSISIKMMSQRKQFYENDGK